MTAAHELLRRELPALYRVRSIIGDRAYRGLAKLAERKQVNLEVKTRPAGPTGFTPPWPLYKIEHVFAQLGRRRRLSRCYEGNRGERPDLAPGRLGRLPRLARRGLSCASRTNRLTRSSSPKDEGDEGQLRAINGPREFPAALGGKVDTARLEALGPVPVGDRSARWRALGIEPASRDG